MTTTEVTLSPDERDDLHALYQACVTDLSFFKAQQWSIANYTFLAYGGLFAAAEIIDSTSCVLKGVFVALVIAVGISSILLVASLHHAIKVRQARLAFIREKLTPVFREGWGTMEKGAEFLNPVQVLLRASGVGAVLAALLIAFGPWQI